jgi:hypothetical protein
MGMGSSDTAGSKAALKNANAAYDTYNKDYGNWSKQYETYRNQADQQYARDIGSADQFAQKMNKSGIQTANQQLDQQSRGAVNQSQLAGRAAGLSKGQAAMNASNTANQTYQNNYASAVNQGAQNYSMGAQLGLQKNQQNLSNTGNLMGQASQGMQGAMGVQQGVGASQQSDRDKSYQDLAFWGGLASSDDRAKRNIILTGQSDWYDNFMKRLKGLGGK